MRPDPRRLLLRWAAILLPALALPAPALPAGAPVPPSAAEAAAPPVALDLRVEEGGGVTRLHLVASRPVAASAFLLDGPERVIVDLPGVAAHLEWAPDGYRAGVVTSVTAAGTGPGRARLVARLSAPATVVRVATEKGAVAGTWRVAVELAPTPRDGFRRAVAAGLENAVATTGSIRDAPPVDGRPVVVLDAGHGGSDPGASTAGGLVEKDLTLAFVTELRDRLEEAGRYRVVLTRDEDVFVPLDERVAKARAAGADLFLSFHADSISSASVRGATIYTGAERATDSESAALALRENAADRAGGLPGAVLPAGVSSILQDLTTRETRAFAQRLAGHLHTSLSPSVRFTVQPHREAAFRVLRAHDVPSALLEIGYMTNARDVELMFSPAWRRRCGEAVAAAIDRFFATRAVAGAAVSP